jgi:hypothetical protein
MIAPFFTRLLHASEALRNEQQAISSVPIDFARNFRSQMGINDQQPPFLHRTRRSKSGEERRPCSNVMKQVAR